jgi:hypothetical protein
MFLLYKLASGVQNIGSKIQNVQNNEKISNLFPHSRPSFTILGTTELLRSRIHFCQILGIEKINHPAANFFKVSGME